MIPTYPDKPPRIMFGHLAQVDVDRVGKRHAFRGVVEHGTQI